MCYDTTVLTIQATELCYTLSMSLERGKYSFRSSVLRKEKY